MELVVTAEVRERGFPAQVGLRVAPGSAAAARVESLLGGHLPVEPNTAAAGVLWLGPDEWLLVDRGLGEAQLLQALAGEGAAVELSANRCAVTVEGEDARDVLSSCCSLDLHPRAFGPGRCVQTLVAGVPVILEATGPEAFRLLVRPSFAAHVRDWLVDAAT
jgi:sarcosine oxidase subunit gamma